MSAAPLLSGLVDRGIRLYADGYDLVVRAPRGILTDADRAAVREHKLELLALVTSVGPDPLDALRGPRRTPWRSLAWSDPGAPPLELFGPPSDDVAGPVAEPAEVPDV